MSILCECFSEEEILSAAAIVMEKRISYGPVFTSPDAVKDFLKIRLGAEEREHFMVMFLDSQHRLIRAEIMFSGTISQTSVHPREVVKRSLELNAAAVVIAHNHPSGVSTPSRADEQLTNMLKTALALVDVRVLDHIVVGVSGTASFAEMGLL